MTTQASAATSTPKTGKRQFPPEWYAKQAARRKNKAVSAPSKQGPKPGRQSSSRGASSSLGAHIERKARYDYSMRQAMRRWGI